MYILYMYIRIATTVFSKKNYLLYCRQYVMKLQNLLFGHIWNGTCIGVVKSGTRARIFKRLWSPGIDSKVSIPPAYVAWRAGTITLFLIGAYSPYRFFKNSSSGVHSQKRKIELARQIILEQSINSTTFSRTFSCDG